MLKPHDTMDLPPAIFLMGPTASGKSNIAMEIAKKFPVEIISVDSAQVYRHMNIGTAKPDVQSLAAAPHHLINLIEPYERYSAAQFCDDALKTMHEITVRRKIPLLTGGTMLYFQALLNGLSDLPSANERIRITIEARAKNHGWPALHEELNKLDPITAARIKPTDSQRIQRALEVCYLTNKPMSEMLSRPRNFNKLPYHIIQIALIPSDRSVLHQHIAQRFEAMIESGLIEEVRMLRDKFALDISAPAMRCVGYRQACMYLDNEISLNKMYEMGLAATRQLAKRQLTWLRSMRDQRIKQIDCLAEDLPEQVLQYLHTAGLIVEPPINLFVTQKQ